METKPDQTVLIKEKGTSNLKMVGSTTRPKSYLYKKDKDLRTSVNKNELEFRDKKNEENEGVLRKDRKVVTRKVAELNNIDNELNESDENKKKLLQEFNDSCINVMLSNHLARKR